MFDASRKSVRKYPGSTWLVVGKEIIDDYDETSGNVRRFAIRMNHSQPDDPEKLATRPWSRWPMRKCRRYAFRSARIR
ncbi:hypothetical protein BN2476_560126 [Paraburkholderia piptadeniae]|uniref:Uncharacterized protein n=1 Tax=Paraburkholderia piptadeniae TaxID=1701573 RepID=A0A1N7SK72_9BURK|nr:hypothetical protein BN2476_560126 [Paraburkholderia piptadeniae]